ncbi:T9SS C-terminal target domain-containing protein [candidate division KSB1 bacterium]|nr:M4 family metallopeptidase [candidate division KSB1 bacterium]RQW04185.1 MAG: T9SS C-terminal target domain-containing protein [candidate division KSB1 bacterium]
MKRIVIFLLVTFALTVAKEQLDSTVATTVQLQPAEQQEVSQCQTANKFTHPKRINRDVSRPADALTLAQINSDLAATLQTLKTLRKASSGSSVRPLEPGSIRTNQNLSALLSSHNQQPKIKIYWNDKNGTPAFLFLPTPNNPRAPRSMNSQSLLAQAYTFFESHASLLTLENPVDELVLIDSQQDALGHTHLRFQQHYRGIKVWGADLYVHFVAGQPHVLNGRYFPTPEGVSLVYSLTQEQAVAKAAAFLNYDEQFIHLWEAEKVIYIDTKGRAAAAWHIELGKNIVDDIRMFIDARTGEVLEWYDNRQTGTPKKGSGVDLSGQTRSLDIYDIGGTNYMVNVTKGMFDGNMSNSIADLQGVILIGDARNVEIDNFDSYYYVASTSTTNWPRNAVSLAYTFSLVYDYFLNVHGHKTLDNKQHNISGIVNLGNKYNNAFWLGSIKLFFFGNGDGSKFNDLAGALDVVAHEYGHGVTQYASNLEYQFQSGALNEAFSDFTGVMAEFYADPANGDWLIGEDALPASSQYNCMRNLANPHHQLSLTSVSPSKMSEYYDLSIDEDNGGVHINSTIPGHAFYVMSTKMSREKVEKIIYRAYMHYLTRRSQFVDCRLAAIQAAKDLYRTDGTDALVGQAFDQVEIYGEGGTDPEPPYDPVSGDDFVLAILDDGSDQIVRITSDMPFVQGNAISYGISSTSKPSITEDGSIIAYIDQNHNINLFDAVNMQNYPVSEDGQWHNIAISPRADYVAITPDPAIMPSVISIIDMNAEQTVTRHLYIPTTTEGAEIIPDYADVLDWSIEGGWLIYDCLFSIQDQYGTPSDTWGIYLTNASNEAVIPLFQPDVTLAVGNPSFSSTRDNVIAFDIIEYSENSYDPNYYLYTYDLFSGKFGLIRQNINTFGHPCFSPDDNHVVFQDMSSDNKTHLWQAAMQADQLNADPSSIQDWVYPVGLPVWYATGTRPGGGEALVAEHFDDASFPPSGWMANHLAGDASRGWRRGNVPDHNFSDVNPENVYSAICGYDESNNQIDRLMTPAFDLTGSRPKLTFWAGYNSYWTSNYNVKVTITKSGSLDPDQTIWQLTVEGDDGIEGWAWRQFTVDLSPFGGRQNVRIYWEYSGKDGDLFALDDVLISTDAMSVDQKTSTPQLFDLVTNYPNPFNAITTFSYTISQAGAVQIKIYNMNGRLIDTLVDEYHTAGNYTKSWRADVSSGLYFYRMTSPTGTLTGKAILVK